MARLHFIYIKRMDYHLRFSKILSGSAASRLMKKSLKKKKRNMLIFLELPQLGCLKEASQTIQKKPSWDIQQRIFCIKRLEMYWEIVFIKQDQISQQKG